MGPSIAEARVIRAWVATYDPALVVSAGEVVEMGREDDEYPGWIWCVNTAGQGGWLARHLLGEGGKVLRDYNTMELTVAAGAIVETGEDCLGWTLARRADGTEGWIPSDHLAR